MTPRPQARAPSRQTPLQRPQDTATRSPPPLQLALILPLPLVLSDHTSLPPHCHTRDPDRQTARRGVACRIVALSVDGTRAAGARVEVVRDAARTI